LIRVACNRPASVRGVRTGASADPAAKKIVIKSYRDDLFPIEAKEKGADGTLYARCARRMYVAARDFAQHSETHRTETGNGPFPVNRALESGLSTASFHEKLPHIKAWLIGLARDHAVARYSELMTKYGLQHGTLFTALKALGEDCRRAEEPIITSIVVD